MMMKIIGALLVFVGCGTVGIMKVASHKREETSLRQMLVAMDFMECDLRYRLTPLPQLCRDTAENCSGGISAVLNALAGELESQIAPDVKTCMNTVLQLSPRLPEMLRENLRQLGQFLGRFDLAGQLQGIETVRQLVNRDLHQLCQDKETRLRCYRTLGFCAGTALIVLFL